MLIIKNENGENIERLLKKFKRKFDKTKILKELRERQEFTKPSDKKRKRNQKAKYIQQLNRKDNE